MGGRAGGWDSGWVTVGGWVGARAAWLASTVALPHRPPSPPSLIPLNPAAVYSRLIAAVGRPDMGLDNPRYATDAARVQHEKEIVDVRALGWVLLCPRWVPAW